MIQRTNILKARVYRSSDSVGSTASITVNYNNKLVFQGEVDFVDILEEHLLNNFDDVCTWCTDISVCGFIPVSIHITNGELVVQNIVMNHVKGSVDGNFCESVDAQWPGNKPNNFAKFVDDRINLTKHEFENQYMMTKEQAEKNVKWIPNQLPESTFIRPSSGQFGNDGKFNVRVSGHPVEENKNINQQHGDRHITVPNNSTLEFDYMVSPLNVEQYMAGPPVRL